MACIKPDGTLTELGRKALMGLSEHGAEEAAAEGLGLPLYRVRMLTRSLMVEGLLEMREGRLAPTGLGEEKLKIASG